MQRLDGLDGSVLVGLYVHCMAQAPLTRSASLVAGFARIAWHSQGESREPGWERGSSQPRRPNKLRGKAPRLARCLA